MEFSPGNPLSGFLPYTLFPDFSCLSLLFPLFSHFFSYLFPSISLTYFHSFSLWNLLWEFTVFSENIKRKKNGDLILTKDERIQFDASHSFLIKSSMAKQKNRAAVENVSIIVSLIEQAGGPKRGKRTISPSITVSELISRNESLKMMLDSASSNSYKTKILRRCFEKTYELLKEETWLLEKYSRLKIPNDIPTVRTMNTLTLKFPHCGRKDEL